MLFKNTLPLPTPYPASVIYKLSLGHARRARAGTVSETRSRICRETRRGGAR